MRISCPVVIFTLLAAFCVPAYAQDAAEDVLSAVILIRSTIPENARTARYLGTNRQGYGVAIDSSGLIVTIGYLVLEAETIEVMRADGQFVSATFVGYDYDTGFGLIRANEPLDVMPMSLGRSSEVKVGDPVLIAGHAGAADVRGARVVSLQEFVGYWEYLLENAIYTSPPIPNFGGAALINGDGQLIGIGSIFTQIMIQGSGPVPCNMFVPIDRLSPVLADLIAFGRSSGPQRPWLGIQAEERDERVFVIRVSSGGPAERSGIQPSDIILGVDRQEVAGLADFYRKIWALGAAGVDVPLSILRENDVTDVIVQSADRYQYLQIHPKN
jgi:S1-C subfamily serine protease